VLAEQAALENYVQGYVADAIDAELKVGFAMYLAEAHKEQSQPDRTFAKDKERFERFRGWCRLKIVREKIADAGKQDESTIDDVEIGVDGVPA
jgi:hypothetical protein